MSFAIGLIIHLLLKIAPIHWLASRIIGWAFINDPDAPGYRPKGRLWHLFFRM